MGDAAWDGTNKNQFKTRDVWNYQPWINVVRSKGVWTIDLCVAQDVHQENQSKSVDKKDIAQALHSKNFLISAESMQISPNGQFCSIRFTTAQIMQTFCTEGLSISENYNIYLKPDYKPRQTKTYTFISFNNVPLLTEEINYWIP